MQLSTLLGWTQMPVPSGLQGFGQPAHTGNMTAADFERLLDIAQPHPELTTDDRFHRYFVKMIEEASSTTAAGGSMDTAKSGA